MATPFQIGSEISAGRRGSGAIVAGPFSMGPNGNYWIVRNGRCVAFFPERAALGCPRSRVYWTDGDAFRLFLGRVKQVAVNGLNAAVKRGLVARPESCSECGDPGDIEAHHADYSNALGVEWLCTRCHGLAHRKIGRGADLFGAIARAAREALDLSATEAA